MLVSGSRRWLHRQWNFLGSGRFTVWLLAALVLVLCAYTFLPQEGEVTTRAMERWVERQGFVGSLSRRLGLTDVLHSAYIWAPCALMFVNLLLCLIRRRATLALCRFPRRSPEPNGSWLCRQVVEADGIETQRLAEALRRTGYRTLVDGERVYGLRGRFAILGHWLFHLGLLALLLVGTGVALAPAGFRGVVGIGEGEPFALHSAPFLGSKTRVTADLPDLRFRMDEIEAVLDGTDLRSFDLRLTTSAGEPVTMGVNRPFRQSPYQVMAQGFGYMPGWAIVDDRGRMQRGSWLKLIPFPLEMSDDFLIGADGSFVRARLFPDHRKEGDGNFSDSWELENPRFVARITWYGAVVHDGLLEPGQRVALQEGLEFFFLPEIRRYALIEVIEERGYQAIYACLACMILGLAVRYVRIRKEILVERSAGGFEIFGRGEIFESLFEEEFERLTERLAKESQTPNSRGRAT